MPQDRTEFQLWGSFAVRLFAIGLIGWFTIIWFQGCLAPSAKEEMRRMGDRAIKEAAPSEQDSRGIPDR
jgi:hypothetical protein